MPGVIISGSCRLLISPTTGSLRRRKALRRLIKSDRYPHAPRWIR